jgi:hypothetical protein
MPIESPDAMPRRRWWIKPLAILCGVLVVAGCGFWAFRATEPSRLCKQARAYLAARDYRNAALVLRRAVTIAPANREAIRLMASLSDELGAANAVEWHEQLAQLDPDSSAERVAWVASAIRSRRMEAAEEALAGAPAGFRSTAEYDALRGMVEIGKGHWREAEQAFGEARRKDPARESYHFNHALAEAQGPDAKMRSAGVETLQRLAKGGSFAAESKRALARVLTRQKRPADALPYAAELASSKEAIFSDHLCELDLIGWLKKEDFPAAMERARAASLRNPADLGALLNWCVQRSMARDCRVWVEGTGTKMLTEPEVIEAYAELIAATNDWPALTELSAKKQRWARGETMRNAFAALAADKEGKAEIAANFWQLATTAAAEQRDSAMALAYFAHRAGWRARLMDVLWAATGSADPEWALRMLHRLCAEDGNTAALLRIARRLQAIKPEDDGARNNAVILGLLSGEPPKTLIEDARRLHEKAPQSAVFASTYAYALHLNGQSAEGLRILESFPKPVLSSPEISLYYAVLLNANGRQPEAVEAAAAARKAKVLPEEERLLASFAAAQ